MFVYYCIAISANILAAIIFNKNINITKLSIIPIILIVLMIFQTMFLKNEKTEEDSWTAYGSNLTADEENQMRSIISDLLSVTIPCIIPFIIFFSSSIKALSIIVYIFGLVGGVVLYRLKNKNKIIDRMKSEEKELQNQEKKEQLGIWK